VQFFHIEAKYPAMTVFYFYARVVKQKKKDIISRNRLTINVRARARACVFVASRPESNLYDDLPYIMQAAKAPVETRGSFPCCAAAFGGNMRFLLRRRLSRTDRCQSDGKSEKKKGEQRSWGMSLHRSHDCLRGVDYLLYLFGRAFIALALHPPSLPPTRLSFSLSLVRRVGHVGHTNGQEVR